MNDNGQGMGNVVLAGWVAMGLLGGCVVKTTDDGSDGQNGSGGGSQGDDGSGGAGAESTTGEGGSANGGASNGGAANGGAEPTGPDLEVAGWSVSYYVPSAGDTNVTICLNRLKSGAADPQGQSVSVSNVGTEAAGAYDVALGIVSETTQQAYYCTDPLYLDGSHAAGKTAKWEGPFCCEVSTVSVPDGTYKLAVLADVHEEVAELDEENNLSLSEGTLEVVTIFGSCQGTPTSCAGRSTYACDNGCSVGHECNGSAQSCYSYFGYASCEQQDGCSYSGTYPNGSCGGYADSCSSMSSDYSCNSQDGCHWDQQCEGAPTPCATFGTPSACSQQPGCGWY